MENIFAVATRNKYRVEINLPNTITRVKGLVSVEDLWDFDKAVIDALYGNVMRELEEASGSKFSLSNSSQAKNGNTKRLECMAAVLKFIYEVKVAEENERKEAANKEVKRRRLLELKAQKQEQQMLTLSEEEIDAMLAEL